jgi:nucleoside-diphosphate-sugar epimerase
MSQRAIVVAGASGFVGRALVNFLVKRGHKNIVATARTVETGLNHEKCPKRQGVQWMQGDLRDPEFTTYICRGAEMVFNLAAQVGGISYIEKNSVECMLSSLINTNLLRACEAHKVTRYFFSSSSCVYSGSGAMKEDTAWPANPKTGYALEKLFSERMCQAFNEEGRVPTTIARFHTLYGPGDDRPPGHEHVIEALCKKVIAAKLSGIHEITVWGDGSQTRSFLYVDDCCEGVYRLACSGVPGPVNLSGSESATVNQLVDMIEDIAAIKLERFYNKSAPVGCIHKMTENAALRAAIAWEPPTLLKDGLRKTYNWMWERAVCGTH